MLYVTNCDVQERYVPSVKSRIVPYAVGGEMSMSQVEAQRLAVLRGVR